MLQPRNVGQALKKRSILIPIAALTAGSDLTDLPIFRCPCALEIIAVNMLPQGASADIDGSNTSVWLMENGTTALATITWDGDPAFPDAGVVASIPITTTTANLKRAEGDVITFTITNGSSAATPATVLEVEYVVIDEAMFDVVHTTNYSS